MFGRKANPWKEHCCWSQIMKNVCLMEGTPGHCRWLCYLLRLCEGFNERYCAFLRSGSHMRAEHEPLVKDKC